MNTQTVYQKLLADKKGWWEGVSDHYAEQATVDAQSNFTLHLAQEKLAAIDRSLRRMTAGTFGKCDTCGGVIDPERLEVLLDSDCHSCATCARLQREGRRPQPWVRDGRDSRQQRAMVVAYRAC